MNTIRQSMTGFRIPRHRMTDEDQAHPERQVHGAAQDAAPIDETAALGFLSRNERRLLALGGVKAVIEDRAYWKKYHRDTCTRRECSDPAHNTEETKHEQASQLGMVQTDGSGQRTGDPGHARKPKRPEAWLEEQAASSAVHLPQLPSADDSSVGAGAEETVQAGARATATRGRGRPRGSKDDPRRPRKNARRR